MKNSVNIEKAIKKYGDFTALKGVSLDIKPGEFFTLLGPSGCGKTTLLRMIAGFNSIDGGEIFFNKESVNKIVPHKRNIGMVFQNYAIFPHLTVYENVAYGLRARKIDKGEIDKKVKEALDLVQISELAKRRPNELSGGQQQRVALARAFVIEPNLLLMDEPLSNLDAKLRVQMRTIIKKLQRRLGITTIYVTHDQEEALAISDRIAVMNAGNVIQVGNPEEIYKRPQNSFVAGFIGVSNFIDYQVKTDENNRATIDFSQSYSRTFNFKRPYKGKVLVSARPEQLYFSDEEGIPGQVVISTFLGDFVEYEVELLSGKTVQINEYTKDTSKLRKDEEKVLVALDIDKINIYDADTGEVLA